jgi:hypothetical protein
MCAFSFGTVNSYSIEFMLLISYADQKGPSCSSHVEFLLMASDTYHFFQYVFYIYFVFNT